MITDMLGQDIAPDAYVAYAVRHGSSMKMNIGKVLEVKETDDKWGNADIKRYSVKIQPLAESAWGMDNGGSAKPARPRNYDKPVHLTALERIIVINGMTEFYIEDDLDYGP